MPFRKTKKYTCSFCSDLTKLSSDKVSFCRDCLKIRSYIREYGLKSILDKLTHTDNKPSCPPY